MMSFETFRARRAPWAAPLTLFLTALCVLATRSERVHAISTNVVISEFRVRGPNGGSDEFVELFNLSSSSVNIGGWKIRGSNNAGTIGDRATITAGTLLGPGCHYLLTNNAASGGPYSGAVPGNQIYGTGITDDGGIALTLADNTIVDQVGLSAGSAFKEGTTLASLGGTNADRGYERKPGGAAGSSTDTDSNTDDFQQRAPSDPQNLSSSCVTGGGPTGLGAADPATVEQGGSVTLTVAVTPGTPSQPITSVTGDLTSIGGASSTTFVDDGTGGDLVAGDLTFTRTATVTSTTTPGAKSLSVTILDATARTGSASIPVTVTLVTVPLAIHDIQGIGNSSPYAGQSVRTTGIVTARIFNNGFFLQSPDVDADGDSRTSEGIFVFTSSAPPASATIGNLVQVIGTVSEFSPSSDPNSPPLTEIVSPSVTLISTGNALPTTTLIDSSVLNAGSSFDTLERLEGMRVRVTSLDVVAPTSGTVSEPNATASSNGVFFGVIPGTARPFREAGVQVPDPLPAGSPAGVPRFDTNPERIRVDSDGQIGTSAIEVTTGATVGALTGVLDFAFRTYSILPDPGSAPAVSGNVVARPVHAPGLNEFTVASANIERFFDTTDNATISDVALTSAAFALRLSKVSLYFRNILLSPDVIAVEEVENLTTLQAIAAKLNADTVDAGQPDPVYVAYLEEGNDPGGIDVGLLVKSTRIDVASVTQFGKDDRFTDPRDGSADLLNDRPPLVMRATIGSGQLGLTFTVIVNHLRSLNGIDDATDLPGSAWVRLKRRNQAEFLANLIQSMQGGGERVVSVGDYNAFQVNDGYVDSIGTIVGNPVPADQVVLASLDLVDPNLVSLTSLVPAAEQYSYSFDGNAQILDHVLVTQSLAPYVSSFEWARSNADFPETLRSDGTRPERISDHDGAVAYFTRPTCAADLSAPVSVTRSGFVFQRATGRYLQQITLRNTGATTVSGPIAVALDTLSSTATLSNGSGATNCAAPSGTPFVLVDVGSDAALSPSETATFVLQFTNPTGAPIVYSTRVLAGTLR